MDQPDGHHPSPDVVALMTAATSTVADPTAAAVVAPPAAASQPHAPQLWIPATASMWPPATGARGEQNPQEADAAAGVPGAAATEDFEPKRFGEAWVSGGGGRGW